MRRWGMLSILAFGLLAAYDQQQIFRLHWAAEPFKNVRSPLEFRGHVQQQSAELATTY